MKCIEYPFEKEAMDKIRKLYYESFEKEEQTPIMLLKVKAHYKTVDFLAFFDDGKFIGFTYLIKGNSQVFIFYLAIENEYRSLGYGTKIVDYIKQKYPHHALSLFVRINNDNSEKLRKFYTQNGFVETVLKYKDRCNEYQAFAYENFDKDELNRMIRKFSFGFISLNGRRKTTALSSAHL